jgi:hypothetical protein
MVFPAGGEAIAALAALAGAVHVLAPDHWVPASLMSWRRRWSAGAVVLFASALLSVHVLGGLVIYWGFEGARRALAPGWLSTPPFLFSCTLAAVGAMALVRVARFSQIRRVLYSNPGARFWSFLTLLSIIGPAEALLPVLVRARVTGLGIGVPLACFLGGCLGTGVACVFAGHRVWNQPHWLPTGISWAGRRRAAIPIVMAVAVGLTFLLRT